MVRRTKEEAAATRERLLDTAEQVFLTRGVARTTLQQIAAAAGLTRGAIYWHFKDKSDLFIAMMDRVVLPCEAVFKTEDLQRAPAPLATLRAALRYPLGRLRDDAHTRRVFTIAIHHTEYNDELVAARERYLRSHARFGAAVETLLHAAQGRAEVDPGYAPGQVALGLLALVDGSLRLATLHADGAPAIAAGLQAIDIYLNGLSRPPTGA